MNISTEIYPDIGVKLTKQFKYANQKNIPYVLVIGPDEINNNVVTLKNMTTGEQITNNLERIISAINSQVNVT